MIMETATKKETIDKAKSPEFDPETMFVTRTGEIKRLSKFGIWRRNNPGGIFEYVDKRTLYRMKH